MSFYVPRVRAYATFAGKALSLLGKELFEDALPLAAVVVVGDDLILCGGEGKRVVGLRVAEDGTAKQVFSVESSRKIVMLAKRSADEVAVADSSGAVRALRVVGERCEERDLFAHFSPLTAMLVLGPFLVTADVDGQVRVTPLSAPRDISHFLLGHSGTVMALHRGRHDLEVVCVARDKTAKYFDLSSGSKLEIDPFANAGKEIQSTKSRKAKGEGGAEPPQKKNKAANRKVAKK
jgi:hypothetical protein